MEAVSLDICRRDVRCKLKSVLLDICKQHVK
nr:MAG TPA: hypothetical protein [Caudoviricetes sp.]